MTEDLAQTITIDATPDVVYDCITDWCSASSPETQTCEILDGGPHAAATVRYVMSALGRNLDYVVRYTLAPPDSVSFTLVRSSLLRRMDGAYRVRAVDAGTHTEVTFAIEGDPAVPLPGVLKRKLAQLIVRNALGDLKAEVESGASGASDAPD